MPFDVISLFRLIFASLWMSAFVRRGCWLTAHLSLRAVHAPPTNSRPSQADDDDMQHALDLLNAVSNIGVSMSTVSYATAAMNSAAAAVAAQASASAMEDDDAGNDDDGEDDDDDDGDEEEEDAYEDGNANRASSSSSSRRGRKRKAPTERAQSGGQQRGGAAMLEHRQRSDEYFAINAEPAPRTSSHTFSELGLLKEKVLWRLSLCISPCILFLQDAFFLSIPFR